jgi:hypothetical protein
LAVDEGASANGQASPTFRLVVGVLIAAVSILGAGVAWSASISSTRSSDLNQQAQQEFLLRQQILTCALAAVGEELRRVASYQEQVTAERILRQQADRLRKTNPDVSAILDQQAQGQAALARSTGYFFFAASPQVDTDGTVTYDRRQAVNNLLSQYVIYQQLHPKATQAEANAEDAKYRHLVAVGIVFVLALFFLTVAEIGTGRIRYPFAAAGTLALVAGAVLWPLVQTGTL